MAFYLFNLTAAQAREARPLREQALKLLRTGVWDIDPDSPHRDALAPGDVALIYVPAPDRVFIGRAELASAAQMVASAETHAYPRGVNLVHVEEWDPPVPMETVLSRIDPWDKAKADFEVGVVRITPGEYQTALGVAAEQR